MSIVRKLQNRFLVYIVFICSCVRMAVTQALPSEVKEGGGSTRGLPSTVRQGLLLRDGDSRREYALEATGAFPYVRVVSLAERAVPVPIEVAGLTQAQKPAGTASHPPASAVLQHKTKAVSDDPFCVPFCDSCLSCGGCCGPRFTSCLSCESCGSCGCSCGCGC